MKWFKLLFSTTVLFAIFSDLSCGTSSDVRNDKNPVANQLQEKATENLSPIKTIAGFINACKNRDIDTVGKSVSKASFNLVEERAKTKNKTVAEVLSGCKLDQLPGSFNEKIYSDTATVDVQNRITSQYDKISFVKEGGLWKIAADLFDNDLQRTGDEDLLKEDQAYNDEVDKIESKVKLQIATAEIPHNYTIEDQMRQAKAEYKIKQNGLNEKIVLAKRHFAKKRKILEDQQKIKNGVFFGCLLY